MPKASERSSESRRGHHHSGWPYVKAARALEKNRCFFGGQADRSTIEVGSKKKGYRTRGELLSGASGKCGSISET